MTGTTKNLDLGNAPGNVDLDDTMEDAMKSSKDLGDAKEQSIETRRALGYHGGGKKCYWYHGHKRCYYHHKKHYKKHYYYS
jgi:hypothetical protein